MSQKSIHKNDASEIAPDSHISVQDLTISYPLHRRKSSALRTITSATLLGGVIKTHKGRGGRHQSVVALRNVSFDIGPRERVGLVGINGSGKTTLLTALAGCLPPIQGRIEVEGQVTAFLSIAMGVDNSLTGYDNLCMRAHHWGIPKSKIVDLEQEMLEFTELGNFFYLPVATYSSGMRSRLLLGLATLSKPDILIMDEWITTGDPVFRDKASKRVDSMVNSSGILVLVSHSEEILRKWTDKIIWLEKGKVKMIGKTDDILPQFIQHRNKK